MNRAWPRQLTSLALGRARLHRLRKNSDSRGFWEGHDFSRAVNSLKMCPRFKRLRSAFRAFGDFFRSLFSRAATDYNEFRLQPLRVRALHHHENSSKTCDLARVFGLGQFAFGKEIADGDEGEDEERDSEVDERQGHGGHVERHRKEVLALDTAVIEAHLRIIAVVTSNDGA